MNLNTITEIKRPSAAEEIMHWRDGDAWLAGGTWLFSEPQIHTDTLIDLVGLKWPALQVSADGLEIAGTCKIVELYEFKAPKDWTAAPLLRECVNAFLSSFKIWNEATVGGNIVMSLPAGPMISLTASLEGICTLWPRNGLPRKIPVVDFVTGNHQNALGPGELVRSIALPGSALRKKFGFRRAALTHLGRSAVLVIGTLDPKDGTFILTITAATLRPIQLRFDAPPTKEALRSTIDANVPDDLYLADPHGSPAYRRHLTYHFAEEIRLELNA